MGPEDVARDLCRRAGKAFRELELFRDLYQRAYKLGYPSRDGWYSHEAGEAKHRTVYDSNFATAWGRLANALYTGMCPPWAQWFHLQPGADVPEEQEDAVLDLLQPHSRAIWNALAQSNYYQALHPAIVDLVAGTGHLLIDDHARKGLIFRAVPIYEVGLEADTFGIFARFWRRKIVARRLQSEFPDAILPDELASQIRDNPDSEIEILTATVEHENPRYEVMQYVVHEPTKRILDERPFFENPWATARWGVLTGEAYGRGPALSAEPGAYSTNEAAKLTLMAANISLFGMWLVDSERITEGTVQLGVGTTIPVKPVGGGDVANAMRPLVPSTNFNVSDFALNDLRSQVKSSLYRDNLAAVERPGMTATEVMERQALVAQDMGAAYGRLTHELLQPVLRRVSGILARRGTMPPEVRLDGKLVGVKYTSALARAQQYEEVVGMRAFMADVANLTAIDPSAKYAIKAAKFARRMAALTGVDLGATRTEDEVVDLAAQEAEGQAEMMRAEQAAQMQQAAMKQGGAPGPGGVPTTVDLAQGGPPPGAQPMAEV